MESSSKYTLTKGRLKCNNDMDFKTAAACIHDMKPGSYVAAKRGRGHTVTLYEIDAAKAKSLKTSLIPGTKEAFQAKLSCANEYVAMLMDNAPEGSVPEYVKIINTPLPAYDDWADPKNYANVDVIYKVNVAKVNAGAIVSPTSPFVIGTGGAARSIQKASADDADFHLKLKLAAPHFMHLTKRPFATGDAMLVSAEQSKGLVAKNVILVAGPDARQDNGIPSEANRKLLGQTYKNAFHLAAQEKLTDVAVPVIGGGTFKFGKLAGEIGVGEAGAASARYPGMKISLMTNESATRDEMKDFLPG